MLFVDDIVFIVESSIENKPKQRQTLRSKIFVYTRISHNIYALHF